MFRNFIKDLKYRNFEILNKHLITNFTNIMIHVSSFL